MSMRGVIFDKDGTLTDLQVKWSPVFCGMIDHLARGDDDVARALAEIVDVDLDARLVIPNGVAAVGNFGEVGNAIRAVLRGAGVSESEMGAQIRAAFAQAPSGELAPIGPVKATFETFVARGVMVGVATADGRENTMFELAQLGIGHLVSELRCGDDEVVKPDPEVLWSIGRAWGLEPSELVYVGDSRADQQCADAAGVRFVALGAFDGDADRVVADIGELL